MFSRRIRKLWDSYIEEETSGVVPKKGWDLSVLLVFPNVYPVAVSNLGFQSVFKILNSMPGVSCDVLFLPDIGYLEDCDRGLEIPSYYLNRAPSEFDIIFFSISFENDLLNVVKLLKWFNLDTLARNRKDKILIAGGIVPTANPLPFAPFFDAIALGDAEVLLGYIIDTFWETGADKDRFLLKLSEHESIFVPFYRREGYKVARDREFPRKGNASVIKTANSSFGFADIIEVARGCPRRCFFCLASHVNKPVRFVLPEIVLKAAQKASCDKVAFLGTSVSEHPGMKDVIYRLLGKKVITFSSLRIDADDSFFQALKHSGTRTATFGIEAASYNLRRSIGKDISDDLIFDRLAAVSEYVENIKLYFMVGLPGESEDDILAFEAFAERLSKIVDTSRVGFSIAPFVPKPHTPFEREPFDSMSELKRKIKFIKKSCGVYRIKVNYELPKWSRLQAVISRGDERVGLYIASLIKKLDFSSYLGRIPDDNELAWSFVKC